MHQRAPEIGDGHRDSLASDIDSGKVAGTAVEAEDAWSPASGRALFALVLQESLFDEFTDQLGYCRDAAVERAAQFGDASVIAHTQSQYLFLDGGVLAVEGS